MLSELSSVEEDGDDPVRVEEPQLKAWLASQGLLDGSDMLPALRRIGPDSAGDGPVSLDPIGLVIGHH